MCDCHPLTKAEAEAWKRAKNDPRTVEDWRFLHDAIEAYKRRIIDRELHRVPPQETEK